MLVDVFCKAIQSTKAPNTVEITVAVSDQGPGVSAEDQKKLFSTYLQIKPGALQQGQGTGVGLSLCKQIVQLHGGVINCQSESGKGSTFSFTIPFGIASNVSETIPEEKEDDEDMKTHINISVTDKPSIRTNADYLALESMETPRTKKTLIPATIAVKDRGNTTTTSSERSSKREAPPARKNSYVSAGPYSGVGKILVVDGECMFVLRHHT